MKTNNCRDTPRSSAASMVTGNVPFGTAVDQRGDERVFRVSDITAQW
jgi:hypothetical protein